jgi:signal transduction histidine kinase
LQRIIDGLLLLSKAEGEATVLGTTDLVTEVKARREQWEALAEETGVRLSVDGLPAADIAALPGAAEQIIDNLIDNALAVAPPGSQIQLVVSHGEQPGIIELHILDEGPGLSLEDCNRAFSRFWRGTQSGEGSGLGLSIVHQLARASGAGASLMPRTSGLPREPPVWMPA